MTTTTRHDRTDVLVIGAGASGATAAKVLTERGLRVVALEKGPWRTRETFSGDELASINRYDLWPDPLLNPRTHRAGADQPATTELFCPVPQMVGGGTVHWQGWLPRFTEDDFRFHSVVGDVPGASLADWPINYAELEPYYTAVEWAFGVSGQAGANRYESFRSKGYPCPPMPMSRYAEKYHAGASALGWNSFPTPQAALSQPFDGRPATVLSAFAQQHGDPTGTRSSALNVFVPQAVATGRYDLRPESYVREITVDERGRAKGAVYEDAEGTAARAGGRRRRPGLRGGRDRAPAAAVHVGPPPARPGQRERPRRPQRHLPRVQLGRGHLRRPDLRVGGRGLRQRELVRVLRARRQPRVRRRRPHGDVRRRASRCRSTGPCRTGRPGVPRPSASTASYFNHSMAASMVVHDLPQHDNRVDLDDTVVDDWGLPVARITLTPHENDLAMGRFLIDRSAEILEAAGATSVQKVYPDRITGNCSHQHGTTRMGDDPDHLGARPRLPGAHGRQPLRGRRRPVPHRAPAPTRR